MDLAIIVLIELLHQLRRFLVAQRLTQLCHSRTQLDHRDDAVLIRVEHLTKRL